MAGKFALTVVCTFVGDLACCRVRHRLAIVIWMGPLMIGYPDLVKRKEVLPLNDLSRKYWSHRSILRDATLEARHNGCLLSQLTTIFTDWECLAVKITEQLVFRVEVGLQYKIKEIFRMYTSRCKFQYLGAVRNYHWAFIRFTFTIYLPHWSNVVQWIFAAKIWSRVSCLICEFRSPPCSLSSWLIDAHGSTKSLAATSHVWYYWWSDSCPD